jgi:hypothetical protein
VNKYQTPIFKTQRSAYMQAEVNHLNTGIAIVGALVVVAIGLFVNASFDAQAIETAAQLGGLR